jgi:hypothetical protein
MQGFLGWAILLLGILAIVLILRRQKAGPAGPHTEKPSTSPSWAVVDPKEAMVQPYPFIFVNADGSARELHQGERDYLETGFHPADGGRPYVKGNYAAKDGWGSLAGYLKRSKLSSQIEILPPPVEDPSRPLTIEEQNQFLRDKGFVVTENPDGSFSAKKPTH